MHGGNGYSVWVVLLGLLGACDDIWDVTRVDPAGIADAGGDGSTSDVAQLDAAGELGFSTPVQLTVLADPSVDGEPSLPSNMLEIYFKSSRSGGLGMSDIWRATRATTADPWSPPTRVDELSSADNETSPRIAPDGKTIWIQRNNTTTSVTMVSTRPSLISTWGTLKTLTEFETAQGDNQFSSTDPSQLVGYLTSERPTTDEPHLFRSTRASTTNTWGTPVAIAELRSAPATNQNPWVTPDGLAIAFSSNRGGGVGGYDLWLATRATTSDPFGTPINLHEVSDAFFDADPWISPDLRHIYFASNKSGNLEIYESSR